MMELKLITQKVQMPSAEWTTPAPVCDLHFNDDRWSPDQEEVLGYLADIAEQCPPQYFEDMTAEYEAYMLRTGQWSKQKPLDWDQQVKFLSERHYGIAINQIRKDLIFDAFKQMFFGGAFWNSIQPSSEQVVREFHDCYPEEFSASFGYRLAA